MKDFIKHKLRESLLTEKIELPIEVGDTVLMGRFKNKKVVIKDIEWDDEKGDLRINGKPALKFRILKKLEEVSRLGHKIPVSNVFFNNNIHANGHASELMKHIDVYQDDKSFEQNPIESVDVRKIVPTQKFITKDNLEDIKGVLQQDNTGAYLVEFKGMYYIIDGHHRIAINIMNNNKTIKAFVQHVS